MDRELVQMVSYAQNAEDVVLMRALSHVEHGFYVDIGAWHPESDSVTKAFYDQGWSGINVEPQSTQIEMFVEQRPRDINIQLAVSDQPGSLSIWVPRYSALATCKAELLNTSIPDYARAVEYVVEADSLEGLLSKYAQHREIHFLKIDVEGYEANIIAGADFNKYRPLVLVIEATSPHTNEPTWNNWEPCLLANGYLFAIFDGLNRFYIREENRELLSKLAVPANCLDGFVSRREMMMRRELADARERLKALGD